MTYSPQAYRVPDQTTVRSAPPAKKFRSRRWLGIPAPVLTAIIAVLLAASVAVAAILFSARATVSGNVNAAPDLRWSSTSLTTGRFMNTITPVPASSVNGTGSLNVAIGSQYATASFHVFAFLKVADGTPPVKVTGVDFGYATVLDVVLDSGYANTGEFAGDAFTSGNLAGKPMLMPNMVIHGNATGPVGSIVGINTIPGNTGYRLYPVHLVFTVKSDAPSGAFGGAVEVPGLKVELVTA